MTKLSSTQRDRILISKSAHGTRAQPLRNTAEYMIVLGHKLDNLYFLLYSTRKLVNIFSTHQQIVSVQPHGPRRRFWRATVPQVAVTTAGAHSGFAVQGIVLYSCRAYVHR